MSHTCCKGQICLPLILTSVFCLYFVFLNIRYLIPDARYPLFLNIVQYEPNTDIETIMVIALIYSLYPHNNPIPAWLAPRVALMHLPM